MKRKLSGSQRKRFWAFICMMLMVVGAAGCGSGSSTKEEQAVHADDEEEEKEPDTNDEEDNTEEEEKEEPEEPEEEALQYIELIEVEDYYGDNSLYDVYVPIGNENEDGFVSYFGHGLSYFASVYNLGSSALLPSCVEDSIKDLQETWQENPDYSDIEVSDMLENGSDRYQIITAKKLDIYGAGTYEVKEIYYMDIQGKGVGVLWNMNMTEWSTDEETDLIIDELAKCYEVDLEKLKPSGDWFAAEEERIRQEEEGEKLPETILWFNATYAPLTYSNSMDWKIVGGMEISSYSEELTKELLSRDWGVEDRESALETVESMIENGHRSKCRECMEELEEMGLLDKDEETFMQELSESGIEDNLFRYVIAYYMYQDGMDADYIAAWDLCRVNQLYADYYVCGYMTYEEAMDASLENSLILQKMYSSWDEMVSAYLLGYQFWQSDPCLTEMSPTLRRAQACEDLFEMEDGPYTLDWDMELEKCW